MQQAGWSLSKFNGFQVVALGSVEKRGRARSADTLYSTLVSSSGLPTWPTLYTSRMLFMVIERFRDGDPRPVRERFLTRGRMLPERVTYHASWIDAGAARCFQVMEAEDVTRLEPWLRAWADLVDFEVVPVLTSQEYWATLQR
jgi:Protein of unknown function (DUF3303)